MLNIEKYKTLIDNQNLTAFESLLLRAFIQAYDFAQDCHNLFAFTLKIYCESDGNVDISLFWDIHLIKNGKIETWHFNDNPKFECHKLKIINVRDLYKHFKDGQMSCLLTQKDEFKPNFKHLHIEELLFKKENIKDDIEKHMQIFAPHLIMKLEKIYLETEIKNSMKETKSSKI